MGDIAKNQQVTTAITLPLALSEYKIFISHATQVVTNGWGAYGYTTPDAYKTNAGFTLYSYGLTFAITQ